MANSSDWLEALREAPRAGETPAWIAALATGEGFVEGFPARAKTSRPEPQPEAPAPDPIADAFERGKAEGRATALAESETGREPQRLLRTRFQLFDQAALDALANELAVTVESLCAKVISDHRPDAETLKARCEVAARKLGEAAGDCALHLHPEDIELLDPAMTAGWRIMPDETMERGGLCLEGPSGSVSDAPEDWRRAIAEALRG